MIPLHPEYQLLPGFEQPSSHGFRLPTGVTMETVDVGVDVGRIERRGRRGSGSRVGGWNSCGPDAVHDSTGSARFRVSGHP